MTREITMIVVHCSATRCNHPYTVHQLYHDHVEVNHWRYIGYHFFISRDGKVHATRPLERMGAHARGWNAHSIGICYEGGLDEKGRPADTRTGWQRHSLRVLVRTLLLDYPGCRICGHRDLSPDLNGNGEIEPEEWVKQCPCFEVSKEQW